MTVKTTLAGNQTGIKRDVLEERRKRKKEKQTLANVDETPSHALNVVQ